MFLSGGMINIDAIGLSVTIIDLIIALYFLVMALIGIKRGFVKMLFKLCGTLAVVTGAVLLASTVAGALIGPLGHFIENPIAEWMAGLTTESGIEIFTQPFNWGDSAVQEELLPMALAAMGLPNFLSGILIDIGVFGSMLEGAGEVALIEVLPAGLTTIIMTIASFVLLLIVFGILLLIIKRFLTTLTEFRLFGAVNRVLGCIFGLAQAYILVSLLLTIVVYIPVPGILNAIQSQIDLSYIAKLLVENNWIGNWLIQTVLP